VVHAPEFGANRQPAVDLSGTRSGKLGRHSAVVELAFQAPQVVERVAQGERPIERDIKRLLSAALSAIGLARKATHLGFEG
jgi:hypothetical protein